MFIRFGPRRNSKQCDDADMTAGEWDKLERDVADAFERIP